MDRQDREVMSESIGVQPVKCDASCLRLYRLSWEVVAGDHSRLECDEEAGISCLELQGHQELEGVLRRGLDQGQPL